MNALLRQSAALAFMRRGEHDIRPDLLLYVVMQEEDRFPRLFRHSCGYLHAWLERNAIGATDMAVNLAAYDALWRLRTRKAPVPARERAKELKLRLRTFQILRNRVSSMLERRLQEAVDRYHYAARGIGAHPQIGSVEVSDAVNAAEVARP